MEKLTEPGLFSNAKKVPQLHAAEPFCDIILLLLFPVPSTVSQFPEHLRYKNHRIQTKRSQISRRSLYADAAISDIEKITVYRRCNLRYRKDHCMQALLSQILRRSLYTDSAPSVSWASTRFARTFPSCTPSWSKLFTFHRKPWNITLFSKCASRAPSVFGQS